MQLYKKENKIMIYELEDICKEEEKEKFAIRDDGTANWAISCIKEEEKEFERLCNGIDEQITMLKNKKDQLEKQLNNKTSFLKGKLAEYFDIVEKKEFKTCYKYKLANGELVFMKPAVRYERDNAKILDWLTAHNKYEFIKTNPSVDWAELKKTDFFRDIDGITEVQTEAEFKIS